VRELKGGRFAVIRYSGGGDPASGRKPLGELRTWMKKQGLKEMSPPVYGYFDPPWTPPFLRRNEVMIRTEAGG
jgi:hypothetical protein